MNPNLKKGPWKPQEDIQLLKCIKHNKGSKKWSEIVKFFDGRTENALKNRYTLIIDKQKKHNKHKNELELIENYLDKCYVDQFTAEIRAEDEDEKDDSMRDRSVMSNFDQPGEFEEKDLPLHRNFSENNCGTPHRSSERIYYPSKDYDDFQEKS